MVIFLYMAIWFLYGHLMFHFSTKHDRQSILSILLLFFLSQNKIFHELMTSVTYQLLSRHWKSKHRKHVGKHHLVYKRRRLSHDTKKSRIGSQAWRFSVKIPKYFFNSLFGGVTFTWSSGKRKGHNLKPRVSFFSPFSLSRKRPTVILNSF